jgi:hypothetical protein
MADNDRDKTLAEDNADRTEGGLRDATPEGVPGQLEYPEAQVNPERAGAYAAGKEEFLYESDAKAAEEGNATQTGWTNPADDRRSEEQIEHNETEPIEMRPADAQDEDVS